MAHRMRDVWVASDRRACLDAGCDDSESKPIAARRLVEFAARSVRSPLARAA